jgi:hypothetical protein
MRAESLYEKIVHVLRHNDRRLKMAVVTSYADVK